MTASITIGSFQAVIETSKTRLDDELRKELKSKLMLAHYGAVSVRLCDVHGKQLDQEIHIQL